MSTLTLAATTSPAVVALANVLFNALDGASIASSKPWPFSPDSLDFSQVGDVTINVDGPTATVHFSFRGAGAPRLSGTLDLAKLEALVIGNPAFAELTIVSPGAAPQTLTLQNVLYQLQTAWSADQAPVGMAIDASNGTITCVQPGTFFMVAHLTVESPTGVASTIAIQIFKNGTAIPSHDSSTWAQGAVYPNEVSASGIDNLLAGDVLDLRAACTTAAGLQLTVLKANFSVFRIA
jgi:hypothetical protein